MEIIDAFGMQCPKPLVLAKKQIDGGVRELAVRVDNETAVKNLTRLGQKTGLTVSIDEIEGGWLVSFCEESDKETVVFEVTTAGSKYATCSTDGGCGYAVFISRDTVGDGDATLGRSLMKMALYTLSEAGDPPTTLLFMNAGVTLLTGEEPQIVESVQTLMEQGTEVLVCGACLDFYGLKDHLAVGEVSNMYDILERMREVAKVITL